MRMIQKLFRGALVVSLIATGSLSSAEGGKKEIKVRTLSAQYADCVLSNQDRVRLAREFLISDLSSDTLLRGKYRRLIDGDCLNKVSRSQTGIQMTFPGELYRYALAGALIRIDFAEVQFDDFSKIAPLFHRPLPVLDEAALPKNEKKADQAKEEFELERVDGFLARYAECAVRRSPVESRKLLASEVASAEEKQTFGSMNDGLSRCMPEGSTVRFGRETLRGAIAVAYYRLIDAARKISG